MFAATGEGRARRAGVMRAFLLVADVVSLVCVTSCRLNWAQTVVMELCTTDDLLTVVLRA